MKDVIFYQIVTGEIKEVYKLGENLENNAQLELYDNKLAMLGVSFGTEVFLLIKRLLSL